MPDTVIADGYTLYLLVLVVGFCIGSFLNVVIYRLPQQMEAAWRRDSMDFLGLKEDSAAPVLNLAFPASHCPQCNNKLKPWHNIPLFSYLFLRGKCAYCKASISMQYPLVELACGLAAIFVVSLFGLNTAALFGIIFTFTLITLTGIDLNHQLLPDILTLPLLWLGLLINTQGVFADLHSAVIGAAGGYIVLWSVYWLFKLITGKEGMGHGDFKLLAALGAWVGWQQLPLIILLSSLAGAIIGIVLMVVTSRDKQIPMAFGPYLAIAGWVALFYGDKLTNSYLNLIQ